jgi:hypothetical protein
MCVIYIILVFMHLDKRQICTNEKAPRVQASRRSDGSGLTDYVWLFPTINENKSAVDLLSYIP